MSRVNFEDVRDRLRDDIWQLLVKYEQEYGVFLHNIEVNSLLTRRLGEEEIGKRVYSHFTIEVIA